MNFLLPLSIGFVGSMHCLGMCGPIAMALPVVNKSWNSRVVGILSYNAGRISVYVVFGIILGIIGEMIVPAGYSRYISIISGTLLLLFIVIPHFFNLKKIGNGFVTQKVANIRNAFSALFKQKNYSSLFFIGTLNGLLPCGLLYLALAGAISTASVSNSGLFMLFFGLGTIPTMISVSIMNHYISSKSRSKITKLSPVFTLAIALLLILRGMNLGVPYISPDMDATTQGKVVCHDEKHIVVCKKVE